MKSMLLGLTLGFSLLSASSSAPKNGDFCPMMQSENREMCPMMKVGAEEKMCPMHMPSSVSDDNSTSALTEEQMAAMQKILKENPFVYQAQTRQIMAKQDPDTPPPATVPQHGEFEGKKLCYNTGKEKNCDCYKMCVNGQKQNDNKCKNYCYEDKCKCRTACSS